MGSLFPYDKNEILLVNYEEKKSHMKHLMVLFQKFLKTSGFLAKLALFLISTTRKLGLNWQIMDFLAFS
jgi:hypothetical protein